jgi:sarcosine oxidase
VGPRSSVTTGTRQGTTAAAAGGENRIFRAAHLGEPGYIPLPRLADRLWYRFRRETGCSLRRRSGCLVMGEAASPSMRLLAAAARKGHPLVNMRILTGD